MNTQRPKTEKLLKEDDSVCPARFDVTCLETEPEPLWLDDGDINWDPERYAAWYKCKVEAQVVQPLPVGESNTTPDKSAISPPHNEDVLPPAHNPPGVHVDPITRRIYLTRPYRPKTEGFRY